MSDVFKISEAASLALHGMSYLGANSGRPVPISEISSALKASQAHLSKVFQRMAREGLVKSMRGPCGGFVLGKRPDRITLLEIYEAIEGPLSKSTCLLEAPVCRGKECILGDLLKKINKEVREHLSKTRLSELRGLFKNGKRETGKTLSDPEQRKE